FAIGRRHSPFTIHHAPFPIHHSLSANGCHRFPFPFGHFPLLLCSLFAIFHLP
ncbi:hypothetical protein PAXRUDRAFT_773343, partial [Paxillus rubicundulus Ve08.2h10]